ENRSAEPTQEDAPITGGIMEIREELGADKSTELGSNDTEEMVNVLSLTEVSSVSPAEVLPAAGVPTVSGSFPTVSVIFTTASVVKHPIFDWEIHSEEKREYWRIIRLGGHTAIYQFFVDMLKQFDREDLHQLWTLVKKTFSIRHATKDKENELWIPQNLECKPYNKVSLIVALNSFKVTITLLSKVVDPTLGNNKQKILYLRAQIRKHNKCNKFKTKQKRVACYFQQYIQQAIPEFRNTMIQHLESVTKLIKERAQLKREYDSWVNERQMQKTKEKEAKKKTQECSRNSKPSLMPSARSQSTSNGSKPKPRSNNQTSRNWLASKSSFATTKTVPIAKHPRNSKNDSCVTKFLKEVNSRAKVPSNKTTNRNKPVEQISVAKKPERQIPKGHRFSIKKTFVVHEKTMTLRSCLRWKLTGRIFKTVGLRWIPTGKIFTSSTTKVDSEPLNGSNADITNQYECEQTLDVSAGTLNLSACTSFNPKEEGLRVWLLKRHISHKLGL
nr:hypothetical protein [Tanacetum cinerariifolium]